MIFCEVSAEIFGEMRLETGLNDASAGESLALSLSDVGGFLG